jgi:hypothetical protein
VTRDRRPEVPIDYTTLSLAEVRPELDAIAREAQDAFGRLDARQLNWRPDAARWSVAQCFDHLVTANGMMLQAAEDALAGARPRTVWERLPFLPALFGRMLIRTQAPGTPRKYRAPARAQPATSDIGADVVRRFVEQQTGAAARLGTVDEGAAARAIMTSPFIGFVTYSVLDGWRLMAAHDRRHIEQARRVTEAPGFPRT